MFGDATDLPSRAEETVMAASSERVEVRDVQVVHAEESLATGNDPLVFERLITETSAVH